MDKKIDLDFFKSLKYDVVLRKIKGKFVLFIAELGLVRKDESLEKAYHKLELAKEEYFRDMIESELSEKIPLPASLKNKQRSNGNIGIFIVKTIIVIIIAAIGASFIFGRIESFVSNFTSSFSQNMSLDRIVSESAVLLDKINNIPDQKIETAGQKLKTTAKKFKPLIDELKILLKETPENVSEGKDNSTEMPE